MTAYLQAVALALVTVILCGVLNKQGKDMSILLVLAVCGMLMAAALVYLEPVLDFLRTLKGLSGMDEGAFSIVLKAVGIGLIAEIAALICADSGNASLGKGVELVAGAAILWLLLPLMTALLELVQQMVGKL